MLPADPLQSLVEYLDEAAVTIQHRYPQCRGGTPLDRRRRLARGGDAVRHHLKVYGKDGIESRPETNIT